MIEVAPLILPEYINKRQAELQKLPLTFQKIDAVLERTHGSAWSHLLISATIDDDRVDMVYTFTDSEQELYTIKRNVAEIPLDLKFNSAVVGEYLRYRWKNNPVMSSQLEAMQTAVLNKTVSVEEAEKEYPYPINIFVRTTLFDRSSPPSLDLDGFIKEATQLWQYRHQIGNAVGGVYLNVTLHPEIRWEYVIPQILFKFSGYWVQTKDAEDTTPFEGDIAFSIEDIKSKTIGAERALESLKLAVIRELKGTIRA